MWSFSIESIAPPKNISVNCAETNLDFAWSWLSCSRELSWHWSQWKRFLHLSTSTFGAKDFLALHSKAERRACRNWLLDVPRNWRLPDPRISMWDFVELWRFGTFFHFKSFQNDEEHVKICDGEMPYILPCDWTQSTPWKLVPSGAFRSQGVVGCRRALQSMKRCLKLLEIALCHSEDRLHQPQRGWRASTTGATRSQGLRVCGP